MFTSESIRFARMCATLRKSFKRHLVVLMLSATVFILICCRRNDTTWKILSVDNPEFRPDTAFVSFEDLYNPKFSALKAKYQLDTIFHGETDELKRILLLRNWISTVIRIDDLGPYEGDGSVESILDEALKGNGFHCGHYSAVQNAVMNAYGYVTRCLLSDVGTPVDYMAGGGHHAINEVWLNNETKWFLSDAKYDYHFEKNGTPLSALEVRDEYLKNKAADITLVKGPGRVIVEAYPELNVNKEQFARIYTWLNWGQYNNRYSNWPNTQTDYMLFYNDDYFKNNIWLWDGKRYWAYGTEYMILQNDRRAIEWTPNVITSEVSIKDDIADIHLHSITPNLKTYQKKNGKDEWQDVPKDVQVEVEGDTNTLIFRSVNLAGVAGPEHRIVISP